MSASAVAPESDDYRRGYAAAMDRAQRLLEAGQRLDTLPMAVAMLDMGIKVEAAVELMRRASPTPSAGKVEVADAH